MTNSDVIAIILIVLFAAIAMGVMYFMIKKKTNTLKGRGIGDDDDEELRKAIELSMTDLPEQRPPPGSPGSWERADHNTYVQQRMNVYAAHNQARMDVIDMDNKTKRLSNWIADGKPIGQLKKRLDGEKRKGKIQDYEILEIRDNGYILIRVNGNTNLTLPFDYPHNPPIEWKQEYWSPTITLDEVLRNI